jgi:hypothetical protein
VLGAALAGVVLLEAGASGEVQQIAYPIGGAMETSAAGLTVLRTVVPHGASVLVYDPHDWSKASLRYLWRYEAALYVLSGHANTRMIVEGPLPTAHREWYEEWTAGTGGTTLLANSDRYQFVLTGPEIANQVPAAFRPVWMQADLNLELFARGGST